MKSIAGERFQIEHLEPFGEVWTPETAKPLDVDAWLHRDLEVVVNSVREAGVIVLLRTKLTRNWPAVYQLWNNELDRTAHIDDLNTTSVVVQMIHANGPRHNTGYATPRALNASARKHIGLLEEAMEILGEEDELYRSLQGLHELLHVQDDLYYFTGSSLEPIGRLTSRIGRAREQRGGSFYISGQAPMDDESFAKLVVAREKLLQFRRVLGHESVHYSHDWTNTPLSTVLAYQNPRDRFTDPSRIIHHFADGDFNPGEMTISRNFIIDSSGFGEAPKYDIHDTLMKKLGFTIT